jgi:hypothetical protein
VSIKLDDKDLIRETVMGILVSHDSLLIAPGHIDPPGRLFVGDSDALGHLLISRIARLTPPISRYDECLAQCRQQFHNLFERQNH